MPLVKNERENFVSILSSDGTFRKVVPEGTEGSVVREYEDSKGNKGTKTELVFNELYGKIQEIRFQEGEFGKNIQVKIGDDTGEDVLSMSTSQAFAEDFMKKLPNINLNETVVISPYSFTDDRGKARKGLSITQNGEKIKNYFYDEESKSNINGFPEPEGDSKTFDTDDWKMYFMKVRKFLVANTEKLSGGTPKAEAKEETVEDVVDEMLNG